MTDKPIPLAELERFIIRAKAATYVGNGTHSLSHRPGSHDLEFHAEPFAYLDSYYGGADFLGQEVVYYDGQAVWAMNYYGRLLDPARLTAAEAGQILKESLTAMYKEGRFLGGFEHHTAKGTYTDTSAGDFTAFTGKEWITCENVKAYELVYHGGLIKD